MKNQRAKRQKRFSRTFRVLAAFSILILIWIFLAPFLAASLIKEKPLEKADAIWVLSGSASYLERIQEAALVYKKGVAPKIFLTNDGGYGGWNEAEQLNPAFVELAKRELMLQGVPSEAIEMLPKVVDGTNYEADLFVETARDRNLTSVLLVTSPYHSRRTLWTFERAALKNSLSVNIGLQSPAAGPETPRAFDWWLSRKGWTVGGEEYVKIAYSWLFY